MCFKILDINIIETLESISIIIASSTAIYGIILYKIEEKWKRKYELAEEVLTKFYEAEHVIRIIRSPFGNINEGKSRNKSKNESPEETKIYNNAYVTRERYENNKGSIEKLQSLKYRFMSVFGKEHSKIFDELNRILNEFFFASSKIAEISLNQWDFYDKDEQLKELRELRKIIYSKSDPNNDPIEERIQNLITKVESVCNDIIGKK